MTKFNELGKVEQAVLEEAYEGIKNGEKKKQKTITENIGKNPSQITRALDSLESQELAERVEDGRTNRVSVTGKGSKLLLHLIAGTEEELKNLLSLHKFTVKFPIKNIGELEENHRSEDWREHFLSQTENEHTHDESNDTYRYKESEYLFTISKNNVTVHIDELVGENPLRLKTRAIKRAKRGIKLVEQQTSIKVSNDFKHIHAEITNQHLAIMKDPLSKLVNESKAMNPKVEITNRQGKTLLWIDNSKGRHDLEAGEKGIKGTSEEDIQYILDFYRRLLENKQSFTKAMNWIEKIF